MGRVLHLLSTGADWQSARGAAALAGQGTAELRAIGPGGYYRDAIAAGWGLRSEGGFELLHTWDGLSLAVAAVAMSTPIVHTLPAQATSRSLRWLRAIMGYRDVQVICPTAALRRSAVESGIPIERCHLVRPGVDFARVRRRRDPALRRRLGLGEEDFAILAAGESTEAAAHADAVWAAAILHVYDPRYRLLLWGRGGGLAAAEQFARRLEAKDMLRVTTRRLGCEVEYEQLLPAADLIVVSATGPVATLPIAISMAAALPIAAAATPTACELLEDRHTALMVRPGSPRELAQRILRLREDGQLQWRLSDTARAEAYEHLPLSRFIEQCRSVETQALAGGPVALPDQAGFARRPPEQCSSP